MAIFRCFDWELFRAGVSEVDLCDSLTVKFVVVYLIGYSS